MKNPHNCDRRTYHDPEDDTLTLGHLFDQADHRPAIAPARGGIVGHWTSCADEMPDDDLTVLVWVKSLDDATLAYHDSEVLASRQDSGWIMADTVSPGRVLLYVTHWCQNIIPPPNA